MEDKKDIGKAFKEKLDGLQRSPGDAVWQSLSADLDKRRKRRLTSVWFRALGIAFAILITATIITYYTWEAPKPPAIQNTGTENSALPSYTKDDTGAEKQPLDINSNTTVNNTDLKSNTTNSSSATGNDKSTNDDKSNNNNGTTTNSNRITRTDINDNNSSGKKVKNTTGNNTGSIVKINPKNPHSAKNNNDVSATPDTSVTRTSRKSSKKSLVQVNTGTHNNTQTNGNTNNTSLQNTATQENTSNNNQSVVQGNNKGTDNITNSNNVTPSENNTSKNDNTTGSTIDTVSASRVDDATKITGTTDGQLTTNDSITKPADSLKTLVEETKAPEEKKKTDSIHPLDFKRWYFAVNGGASKYVFPSNRSIIDSGLDSNTVSVKSSFNYGAYIGYRFNVKWGVRLGINSTKIEQVTKNAYLLDDMQNPANFEHVKYATVEEPDSDPDDPGNPGNPSNPPLMIQGNEAIIRKLGIYADIQTKITYIEIPAEVTFHTFGNRLGADITGGLSTLFINKNTVTASNEMGSVYMGTLDSKKISFSTNVGLRFYYQFIPALQLNIEPAFKYYLNTFDNVKPYSLNLQAGFQYNFDIGKKR